MLILYQSPTYHQSLQWQGCRLDVQSWRPSRGSKLYPCHNSQTGSKTHLASYPVGTRGSFCWGMRFTTHSSLVLTCTLYEAVCPLPHTSSWHSVQLLIEKTPTLSTFLKKNSLHKKSRCMSQCIKKVLKIKNIYSNNFSIWQISYKAQAAVISDFVLCVRATLQQCFYQVSGKCVYSSGMYRFNHYNIRYCKANLILVQ